MRPRKPRVARPGAVLAMGLALAAGAVGSRAQEPTGSTEAARLPVSVELRAGLEYDSNVAVLELDRASGASDLAALLELGLGYERRAGERISLDAGYHFSQKRYRDFGQFDLQIHRGSGGLSGDLGGGASVGLTGHYINAALDGDGFVVMQQLSPHFHKLFGTRFFLRLAYTHTDKEFTQNPDRDARANSLSSDAFIFLNGLTTYLVLGYRHDRENALAAHFDYTGNRLRAQLTHRLDLGTRRLTLRGQLRYENRRYRQPTPAIAEPRRDRRVQLEALAELPLTERMRGRLEYRHADNRSNLTSVNFGEHVWALSFILGL